MFETNPGGIILYAKNKILCNEQTSIATTIIYKYTLNTICHSLISN